MIVTVMIAMHVRIIAEGIVQQRFHRIVRIAAHTAVQANPLHGERLLCTAADTAADQNFYLVCCQESTQCAVAVAICINNLACNNFAVFHIVNFEL